MLNIKQIKALAHISDTKVKFCNNVPIAIAPMPERSIKFPYQTFVKFMEIDDLRLEWLLGKGNFIAGGAVLNWIWGEHKNNDIDFFFRTEDSHDMFVRFIESIGFEQVTYSGYATTYFNTDSDVIIQLVGGRGTVLDSKVAFDEPEVIIETFDFHVCKFAVDNEFLYTTTTAIRDLLTLSINFTGHQMPTQDFMLNRALKYHRKGFFLSRDTRTAISIEPNALPEKDNNFLYGKLKW